MTDTYECIECSRRLPDGSADLVIDEKTDQVRCSECASESNDDDEEGEDQ